MWSVVWFASLARWQRVLDVLQARDLAYAREGATWLRIARSGRPVRRSRAGHTSQQGWILLMRMPIAQPPMRISATVLGAPDPPALGAFYARLLGWNVVTNDPEWVMVKPPAGGTGLSFQLETEYIPPV